MIRLTLKREPTVPLEAEVLSPDMLCDLGHRDICGLTVYHGKRQLPLEEFFEIEGERSDSLHLAGNLSKVRWIGRAMTKGSIHVDGSVGMHLGAYMKGGRISVTGDAGDWIGAEMKNGWIHVAGNAGGQIGGAYRGSLAGMRNGLIHIGGSAGLEVGLRMRRGTIVVGDVVRDFAGLQMKGGTLVLLNGAELRTGAWMNRGTILSMVPLQLMPTFVPTGQFESAFLPVLGRYLADFGITLPCAQASGCFERFTGDIAVPGQGEILVWNASATAA